MKDKLLEQAKHEHSAKRRLVFLLLLAPFFLFLLPYLFILSGARLDGWLNLPSIPPQPFNLVLGGLLILPGSLFARWSIYSQFTLGRGTPMPLMATQQRIVQPPYTYCRNPMALGAIVLYLGVTLLFQTPGGTNVVLHHLMQHEAEHRGQIGSLRVMAGRHLSLE